MPVETIDFNVPQYSAPIIEDSVGVGYSFASNPIESSKPL